MPANIRVPTEMAMVASKFTDMARICSHPALNTYILPTQANSEFTCVRARVAKEEDGFNLWLVIQHAPAILRPMTPDTRLTITMFKGEPGNLDPIGELQNYTVFECKPVTVKKGGPEVLLGILKIRARGNVEVLKGIQEMLSDPEFQKTRCTITVQPTM